MQVKNQSPKQFALEGNWAEISEGIDPSLRKLVFEFAKEYAKQYANPDLVEALIGQARTTARWAYRSIQLERNENICVIEMGEYENKRWADYLTTSARAALIKAGVITE